YASENAAGPPNNVIIFSADLLFIKHACNTSFACDINPIPTVAVAKNVTNWNQNCGVFIASSTCTISLTILLISFSPFLFVLVCNCFICGGNQPGGGVLTIKPPNKTIDK